METSGPILKICIIGNSGVGKTAAAQALQFGAWSSSLPATIGVEFKTMQAEIPMADQQTPIDVRVQLWDTAGQERFNAITNAYFRGAHGIILAYDATNPESLTALAAWLERIQQHTKPDNSPCMQVICTKLDAVASAISQQGETNDNTSTTITSAAKQRENKTKKLLAPSNYRGLKLQSQYRTTAHEPLDCGPYWDPQAGAQNWPYGGDLSALDFTALTNVMLHLCSKSPQVSSTVYLTSAKDNIGLHAALQSLLQHIVAHNPLLLQNSLSLRYLSTPSNSSQYHGSAATRSNTGDDYAGFLYGPNDGAERSRRRDMAATSCC